MLMGVAGRPEVAGATARGVEDVGGWPARVLARVHTGVGRRVDPPPRRDRAEGGPGVPC